MTMSVKLERDQYEAGWEELANAPSSCSGDFPSAAFSLSFARFLTNARYLPLSAATLLFFACVLNLSLSPSQSSTFPAEVFEVDLR